MKKVVGGLSFVVVQKRQLKTMTDLMFSKLTPCFETPRTPQYDIQLTNGTQTPSSHRIYMALSALCLKSQLYSVNMTTLEDLCRIDSKWLRIFKQLGVVVKSSSYAGMKLGGTHFSKLCSWFGMRLKSFPSTMYCYSDTDDLDACSCLLCIGGIRSLLNNITGGNQAFYFSKLPLC